MTDFAFEDLYDWEQSDHTAAADDAAYAAAPGEGAAQQPAFSKSTPLQFLQSGAEGGMLGAGAKKQANKRLVAADIR